MLTIDLYSGIGGACLAHKLAGDTIVGYVENDAYCRRVLRERMRDGYLDEAPLFGDIRLFLSRGFAREYTDMVDLLAAGPPCQPFSVAGRMLGGDDPRDMFPATYEAVEIIRPTFVLIENVSGIYTKRYILKVIKALRAMAYKVLPPVQIEASYIGAPHKERRRVFILAYADKIIRETGREDKGGPRADDAVGRGGATAVDDAEQVCGSARAERSGRKARSDAGRPSARTNMVDTDAFRKSESASRGIKIGHGVGIPGANISDTNITRLEKAQTARIISVRAANRTWASWRISLRMVGYRPCGWRWRH